MTTIAPVARLAPASHDALKAHFAELGAEDRRLRFGASLNADAVDAYVDRIDFSRDGVFGVHDERLALIGVAHVAMDETAAELGVSVLPAHRARGIGGALFDRAVEHARNRFVSALCMHCLADNPAIMHLARRSGMRIVVDGGEADAHLALPPATLASITGEFLTDRIALYDYSLKKHAAMWTRVTDSLMPAPRLDRQDEAEAR
jgi:GNAT superfamily N-acetyltransferase